MNRILLLSAAAAATLSFAISPGRAAYIGNAPCEYASIAACQPNVIAGNRGFCQINPYYSSAPPYGAPHVKRAPRHRHQY